MTKKKKLKKEATEDVGSKEPETSSDQIFAFPDYGVSIEAESMEAATKKLNNLLKHD